MISKSISPALRFVVSGVGFLPRSFRLISPALGMDYGSFSADQTVKAVEVNLIVIGEAASQILREVEEQHPANSLASDARCATVWLSDS